MNPFRLFVILVLLTASALIVVFLRVSNVRTAYRIQTQHARQIELRNELWKTQARIANYSDPALIAQRVATESIPVVPPQLPGAADGQTRHTEEWETD